MTIDPEGPVEVYRQLAQIIRDKIAAGDYAPGRRIPSVVHLIQEHGVSRGTVVRAIGLLVDDDLVTVVRGKGTFVRDPKRD